LRKTRLPAPVAALAVFAVLAAPVAALAATSTATAGGVVAVSVTPNTAGYELYGQGNSGGPPINDVRGTDQLPADESTATPANSIGGWLILQQLTTGGSTVELAEVYDDTASTCPAADATLTWSGETPVDAAKGGPLALADLVPLAGDGNEICLPGSASFYGELHYSTSTGVVSFIAGPSEADNNVLAQIGHVWGSFLAPAVGFLTTTGAVAAGLTPGSVQGRWSRVGVTEPAGSNVGAVAGQRITFDWFKLREWVVTVDGFPLSAGDPELAGPTLLPAAGSMFDVVVPAVAGTP
jgi:hypothetical protein